MRICLTLKAIITTVVLILAQTAEVNAADRTWVSAVGSDGNPCSRTSPCLTFGGALAGGKTSPGGEIDALDPGDFTSTAATIPVTTTISQAVTIDGTDTLAGILIPSSINGITVAAGPTDVVVLRNITFNGFNLAGANGILFTSGAQLVIENCKFIGWGNTAISSSGAGNLVIKNSSITNCTTGVNIDPNPSASSIILDNVSISETNNGLVVFSGKVDIWNCFITQNTIGIACFSTSTINCLNSLLTANTTAISTAPGATVFISNNDFYDNTLGFDTSGGGSIETANNNRFSNNGSGNSAPTSAITIQ